MPDIDTEPQQSEQPRPPLFPQSGGSYTRCPVTGALTPNEPPAEQE